MRLRDLFKPLYEAPIEDFQTIGDFSRNSSFRKPADRRLITNPVYVERVKNMFAKTDIDIRMYFVNSPEANRFLEEGMVDPAWMQENMPKTLEAINQKGGLGDQSLNMIYASNKGLEWRPMTGWIMAHRMAHVVLRPRRGNYNPLDMIERDVGEMFKSALRMYNIDIPPRQKVFELQVGASQYTRLITNYFQQIGTMKSAREKAVRTPFEFLCECFAQYLITGTISFNPPAKAIITGHSYGRPSYRGLGARDDIYHVEDCLEYCATSLQTEFDRALHAGVGQIFVM